MNDPERPEADAAQALGRWQEELRFTREATERCVAALQQLEHHLAQRAQEQAEALRNGFTLLRDALEKLRATVQEKPPSWLQPVEDAARAARAALEQVSVLDATQAASLTAMSEEVKGLRTELGRLAANLETAPEAAARSAEAEGKSESPRVHRSTSEPMLEIVRMHVELLRTLLERGAPAARSARHLAESVQEVDTGAGDVPSEGSATSAQDDRAPALVAKLRTEVRGVAASLEQQISELREEQLRRIQTWERRLDDVQQGLEHALSHDRGRRLLLAMGLGLLLVLAAGLLGLMWYRAETFSSASLQERRVEGAATRSNDEKAVEYQRLLTEAEVAVARGDWEKAERVLSQASRLRPEAAETQVALSAVIARRGLGTEVSLGAAGQRSVTGLTCSVRDGRLCCIVAPDKEQCVPWPAEAGQTVGAAIPTPTLRQRQRGARTAVVEPPLLDDEDEF